MQKSTMLFVVSILLLIGGGLGIVIGLLGLVGAAALGAVGGIGGAALGGIVVVALIVSLAASGVNIAAGIIGIKHHKSPATADTALTWGKILIGIQAASLVLAFIGGSFGISSIVSFALPVLYYVGANQLKQMQ